MNPSSAMDQTQQPACYESDSDSDRSDRKPSFPELQRLSASQQRRWDSARDEDSSRLYMSEPSGTEDGDASSGIMFHGQSSGTFHDNRLRSHRHLLSRVPNSPGNTSLSSRETSSPAGARSVVFQFAPDRPDTSRSSWLRSDAGSESPSEHLQSFHPGADHANSPSASNYHRSSPAYSLESQPQPQPRPYSSGQSYTLKPSPSNTPSRSPYLSRALQSTKSPASNQFLSQRAFRTRQTRQQEQQRNEHRPGSDSERDLRLFNNGIFPHELSEEDGPIGTRYGVRHQSDGDNAWSRSNDFRTQSYSAIHGDSNLPMDASIAMTLSEDSEPEEVPHSFLLEPQSSAALGSNSERSDPAGVLSQRSKRRVAPAMSWHKRSRRRGMEQHARGSVDDSEELAIDGFSDVHAMDGLSSKSTGLPMGQSNTCSENLPSSPQQKVNSVLLPSDSLFSPDVASTAAMGIPGMFAHKPVDMNLNGIEVPDMNHEPLAFFDANRGNNHSIPREQSARLEANLFENNTKGSPLKASRQFLPRSSVVDGGDSKYKFFTCPRCKTRQREFFTVSSAPNQDSGPSGYLALYFTLYVISSLFIFGLEEGWKPLDCIYFAVITLTTCGLGDFVPTTPGNKLICSLFIYVGCSCIGLLLGTYIAGILDDKASRDRKSKQMESCPNCKHIQNMKDAASGRFSRTRPDRLQRGVARSSSALRNVSSQDPSQPGSSFSVFGSMPSHSLVVPETAISSMASQRSMSASELQEASITEPSNVLLSPVTQRVLGRRGHTRHVSIDLTTTVPASRLRPDGLTRSNSHLTSETTPLNHPPTRSSSGGVTAVDVNTSIDANYDSDNESEYSDSSESTTFDIMDDNTFRIRAAKYVILTIRQALLNSIVIIALGCLGFWFIEGFTVIDSWYFTTVLLTTTGYGDITPYTKGGKLFATVYILVAGTILLNNMSMISIIPLELRRRRIERAVLTQFGDELDDDALRELATGPTVQRLHLTANRPDGLDECTREMFSLAMLVRLGKVTEEDIKETFAAFRRLDVNDDGVLNSRSIIGAMIHKSRSRNDLSRLHLPQTPSCHDLNNGTSRSHGERSEPFSRG